MEIAGREVVVTNPDKIFFPRAGHTKLDLVRYYAAVAEGALRGIAGRPIVLKRYVDGAEGEPFFQKRAPEQRPDWIETVELRFPSGRTAREVVVRDAAQLLWIVNLGCIDLNPHPVRADDLEHPDELRVDLDPGSGVAWADVRQVALLAGEVLARARAPRLAQDLGLARHARQRAPRAAVDLRPGPARGPGAGPRGGATCARPGQQQVVEGGAPRRLPRLQPERQGPDGGLGVVGAAHPRRARLDAARVGRGGRLRSGGLHAGHRAGPVRRAGRRGGRHRRRPADRSTRCSRCPPPRRPPDSGMRRGLRTTASRPTSRRAWRRRDARPPGPRRGAASRRARSSPSPRPRTRRTRSPASSAGRQRHPEAAARLHEDDVLVDSMRGRSTTWTRIRVNLRHVPEGERPAAEPPDPDYDPWSGSGRGRAGSRAPKTRSSS